jgi:DNA processing protein
MKPCLNKASNKARQSAKCRSVGKRGDATFPRRNRIVAGLCRAVVGVEAARRSGSLITAKFAAEAGREIFAVPGSPLDPRAEGANDLLRDGATFCTKAEDVTSALAEQNLSREQPDAGFFRTRFREWPL